MYIRYQTTTIIFPTSVFRTGNRVNYLFSDFGQTKWRFRSYQPKRNIIVFADELCADKLCVCWCAGAGAGWYSSVDRRLGWRLWHSIRRSLHSQPRLVVEQ